jgi:TRAP-type mannitol/chloroaromatic compound transport system permease small subunit
MNKILEITDRLSTYAVWISGTLLLLTCFMIAIEVVLRKVFSVSIGGADELSNYVQAMSCSWAFSYALFRKAHIRIDVLYIHIKKQTMRFILDIVSLLFFGFYMSIVSYFSFGVFYTSFIKKSIANTPMATPLWIPQGLWLMGILAFTLTIFLILAGVLYNWINGDHRQAENLASATVLD